MPTSPPEFNRGPNRRRFLSVSTCSLAAAALGATPTWAAEGGDAVPANRGRIYKSVKWGMIGEGTTVAAKFRLCHELGFDGMELVSPSDLNLTEVLDASRETGMPVHGLVDMKHWQLTLSSPEADVRSQGRKVLQKAIRDAHDYGGDSVLLVPGVVRGEEQTHQHVWDRSTEQIRQVLPLAAKLGVRVLIENVWNGFCETPTELRDYIDQIDSPWVGVYFDIGNAQKFAPSQEWIRTLGSRIVKLDVKGWGQADGFGKIGDGDVDWPEVRNALADIDFSGWCTAEVAGGDRTRLAEIAERMNKFLAL